MDKRIRMAQRFGFAMMLVCFLLAGVAATVAALIVIDDGDLTVAGLAIGGTGYGSRSDFSSMRSKAA